jgi:hypothetical protein
MALGGARRKLVPLEKSSWGSLEGMWSWEDGWMLILIRIIRRPPSCCKVTKCQNSEIRARTEYEKVIS